MDRRLLERLVGGAILLAALLVTLPFLLTGEGPSEPALVQLPAVAGSGEMRTHVITPARSPAEPPVPQHLPPLQPAAQADSTPGPAAPALAEAPAAPAQPSPPPAATAPTPAPPAAVTASTPAPPAAARAAAPAAPGSGWIVQVGSFQSQRNADRLSAELRERDFQSYVTSLQTGSVTLYRVRVGPAARERSEAQALAGRLKQSGFGGQVTREEP